MIFLLDLTPTTANSTVKVSLGEATDPHLHTLCCFRASAKSALECIAFMMNKPRPVSIFKRSDIEFNPHFLPLSQMQDMLNLG